jgi:hypothetical protein
LEKRSGTVLPSIWGAEITSGFEPNDVGQGQTNERLDGGWRLIYRDITPGRVFRNYSFNLSNIHNLRHEALDHDLSYAFNDALQVARFTLQTSATFVNYWGVSISTTFRRQAYSETFTRGGPLVVNPSAWSTNINMNSDRRLAFNISPSISYENDNKGGTNLNVGATLAWRPTAASEVSIEPSYLTRRDVTQYVATSANVGYAPTFGPRYIFANVERREIAVPIRLNWVFSPTLTLQLFAQPLFSTGDFVAYKQLERPSSFDFDVFEEGSALAVGSAVTCVGGRTCVNNGRRYIDFTGTGAPGMNFADRDFNQRSLRGNAVLRWEYRPGSTVFLVWQQNRLSRENIGDMAFSRDAEALFDADAENTFIIKASYWLGL